MIAQLCFTWEGFVLSCKTQRLLSWLINSKTAGFAQTISCLKLNFEILIKNLFSNMFAKLAKYLKKYCQKNCMNIAGRGKCTRSYVNTRRAD